MRPAPADVAELSESALQVGRDATGHWVVADGCGQSGGIESVLVESNRFGIPTGSWM